MRIWHYVCDLPEPTPVKSLAKLWVGLCQWIRLKKWDRKWCCCQSWPNPSTQTNLDFHQWFCSLGSEEIRCGDQIIPDTIWLIVAFMDHHKVNDEINITAVIDGNVKYRMDQEEDIFSYMLSLLKPWHNLESKWISSDSSNSPSGARKLFLWQ